MAVELTSPAEGLQPGEEYSGDHEDWLVANGYAKREGSTEDHTNGVTSDLDADPTYAGNREDPDEETPGVPERPAGLGPEGESNPDAPGIGQKTLDRDAPVPGAPDEDESDDDEVTKSTARRKRTAKS